MGVCPFKGSPWAAELSLGMERGFQGTPAETRVRLSSGNGQSWQKSLPGPDSPEASAQPRSRGLPSNQVVGEASTPRAEFLPAKPILLGSALQ